MVVGECVRTSACARVGGGEGEEGRGRGRGGRQKLGRRYFMVCPVLIFSLLSYVNVLYML